MYYVQSYTHCNCTENQSSFIAYLQLGVIILVNLTVYIMHNIIYVYLGKFLNLNLKFCFKFSLIKFLFDAIACGCFGY